MNSLRLTAIVMLFAAAGANWPQFRGVDSASIADGPAPPVDFDVETGQNIAWKADLPGRAASGAIVVDGRVIVTASSGAMQERLHVMAFDGSTGERLWQRDFWATGRTLCHPTSAIAAPTPASDGTRIFAFFSSNDLVCLDLEGNLQWLRGLTYDFPTAANDVGMASSPIVVGSLVIVQVENLGTSFAAALDTSTGLTKWRIERKKQMNWCSPTLVHTQNHREDLLLLQAPDGLAAFDAQTAKPLWRIDRPCEGIPSALGTGGLIFVASQGITALRVPADGHEPEVVWSDNKLAVGNASPVVYDGRLYALNRAGAITCAETATGKIAWRLRIKGTYWATPVVAGGTMFCANYDGLVTAVKLDPEQGEIVGESSLGEPVMGSPAIVDAAMYLRSDKHLWKIASQEKAP
ncbi:MAG TPA: PQQ-binding-like beta-propeller repeat protein [Pirellulales bacterium]|jgi:outer membrane protein assembly factor BamB|nr:PQQ-binding-like beta-propeller repeat protein [Pirellulales bacterium]